jgi:hypothetical protein
MIEAIQNFFRTGLLLKEVNATILTLVPKKPNALVMGNFRPIECFTNAELKFCPTECFLFWIP